MSYHGFLRLGGVDVVNTERARGYLETSDCPSSIIQAPRCETIQEAVGDDPYTFDNISLAPWYDLSLPDLSSRFFGVVGVRFSGLGDSSRSAESTEGVGNGGTIGRVRKGMKSPRIRATLISQGDDAMEYGRSWLDAMFDGQCGQHGDGCGTMDMEYLADCPPPRGTVPDFTPWAASAENLAKDPSYERSLGTVEIRRQYIRDPRFTDSTNWTIAGGTPTYGNGGVTIALTGSTGNMLTASRTAWFTDLTNTPVSASWTVQNIGDDPITVEPRIWDGVAYATALAVTIPAGATRVVKIENKTMTGTYAQPRLWQIGSAAGSVVFISKPTMEKSAVAGLFFDGTGSPDSDFVASWTGVMDASESILTADRATGGGNATVRLIRSGRWALSGTHSLRMSPLWATRGTGYVDLLSTDAGGGLVRGQTYTAFVSVRKTGVTQENVGGIVYVAQGGATSASSYAPPVAGVHMQKIIFTVSATGWGYLRLYHGGAIGEPDIWMDNLLILEGAYEGDYFDGNSASSDTARYSWTGTPDASTSLLETRAPIDRPQTDVEYAKVVNDLRRFMHSVSVTSGAYVVEERTSRDGRLNIATVEWVVTTERPWTYSTTRPVQLPVTPTTVIQDIPFNLVPYPSAEVASGVVAVATNYSLNPSLEVNATGWAVGADGTNVTTAMLTSGRVTGEVQAVGTSSFRSVFTATGAGANGSFWIQQEVDISARAAGSAVSVNFWAAELLLAGAPVRPGIEMMAIWRTAVGGTPLRTDSLGVVAVDGGAMSVKGMTPPAGANAVLIRATARLTSWPAGTILRLYADALAVTVP